MLVQINYDFLESIKLFSSSRYIYNFDAISMSYLDEKVSKNHLSSRYGTTDAR